MLSEEEVNIVKGKLQQLCDKNQALLAQVHKAERDIEQAEALRNMIPIAYQEKEEEENMLIQEISNMNTQFRLYSAGKSDIHKKVEAEEQKLRNLEEVLAIAVEKIDLNNDKQEMLDDHLRDLEEQETVLFARYAKLKQTCEKFTCLKFRLRTIVPVGMNLEDLENTIQQLQDDILSLKDRQRMNKTMCERITQDNDNMSCNLSKRSTDLQEILDNLKLIEMQDSRVSSDLSNLTDDLTTTSANADEWESKLAGETKTSERETTSARLALNEVESRLKKLDDEVEAFPAARDALAAENEILITKKKQLCALIQKKIDDWILEYTQKQNQSPEVMELSRLLADHWMEHQKLSEACSKGEAKLYKLQETLERKKYIATELKVQNFQFKERGGMKYFDAVYLSSMNTNRQMAEKMRNLQRELYIMESENRQYRMELAEKAHK